jgi:hypothetical protein
MSELEFGDFTHGILDTITGGVCVAIFLTVLQVYTSPVLSIGEGVLLVVITGLAAILGARILATGVPNVILYPIQEYLKTKAQNQPS